MRLQRPTSFTTAVLGVVWCCASAHSQQKPPFTITISGPQTIPAGSDLAIHIVTNVVSDQTVDLCDALGPDGTVERYYKVAIHDDSGKEPPITDFGRQAKRNDEVEGSRTLCEVDPKETLVYSMEIGKQYDLSKPGKYVLQVSRGVSDIAPSSAIVKSNEFAVTVVPASANNLPFMLTIRGTDSATPDGEIRVDAALKNMSNHAVRIVWGTHYIVLIHGKNGEEPPRKSGLVNGGSLKYLSLAPGETSFQSVFLTGGNGEYDLSEPGNYIVQLQRPMDDAGYPEGTMVESNEWIVTVIPKSLDASK